MWLFNVLPGTRVVFFFIIIIIIGSGRHKKGDMQLLGWTVVLLCQWILRKVSFSAPQTNKQKLSFYSTEMYACGEFRDEHPSYTSHI